MAYQAQKASPPQELTGRLTEVALGYQAMLERTLPSEALVGISLVALASRQPERR